ncbi:endonuclease/exonuclease/phosphatase family protein [Blautia argi]|uniref:endonuclease/exonuclease/phosphatase family protein n=1 Tax=Blautia argi TaxID=1912897 RepID=UPI001FA8D470|nr:endonuclease/exonuclease/phosphatase family protein [Blautia argi]
MRDYYVVGCGRSRELDGEQVAIAFKYKSFNMISMETFWLSPDCFLPGSRYAEQSECPRVCTELVLEDLSERKVFRVLNTHLDHLGAKARQLGLSQILRKLEEERYFAGIPVILAGDFNAEPESDEMEILREHKDYVNLTEGIGSTYHGFSSEEQEESIDYIYVRNGEKTGFSCTSVEKWKDRKGSVWLSDHYPVCVCLEWD